MPTFEQLSSAQKGRAALARDVHAIAKETCHFLGLEISKPAMDIVTELVYKKLSVYATDLEAFAKHAKRATVNTEDVKLLVRRNPSLRSHLEALAPTAPSSKAAGTSKEKKRKTIAGAGQSETPSSKSKDQESIAKQKKTESHMPKQKIPEASASISTEVETDKLESIIADDLIDLTFD